MNNQLPENTPFLWWKRVYSLADVNTYLAKKLVFISEALEYCQDITVESEGSFTEVEQTEMKEDLDTIETGASEIGLSLTAVLASRILGEITPTADKTRVLEWLWELKFRLHDELQNVNFFFVHRDRFQFYDATEPAGPSFKSRFPRANDELIEAGKCLALDRATACVFHLMRALESPMLALLRAANPSAAVPVPGSGFNWGAVLKSIDTGLQGMWNGHGSGKPPRLADYQKFHAMLAAAKQPFRNETMHFENTYTLEDAERAYNAVTSALAFVPDDLKE